MEPESRAPNVKLPDWVLLLMMSHTYRAGAFLDAARALGVEAVVGSERPQALASLHPLGHLVLDFGRPERGERPQSRCDVAKHADPPLPGTREPFEIDTDPARGAAARHDPRDVAKGGRTAHQ